MNVFNVTFQPGRYLVQTFPWMRYIPAWLPGAGFQREFAAARPRVRSMRDVPWEAAVAKKVCMCACGPREFQCLIHTTMVFIPTAPRPHGTSFVLRYTDRANRGWTRRRTRSEVRCSFCLSRYAIGPLQDPRETDYAAGPRRRRHGEPTHYICFSLHLTVRFRLSQRCKVSWLRWQSIQMCKSVLRKSLTQSLALTVSQRWKTNPSSPSSLPS